MSRIAPLTHTEKLAYGYLEPVIRWAKRYPELLGLLTHNMTEMSGVRHTKQTVAHYVRPGRYWREPKLGTALLILAAHNKIVNPQEPV